MVATSTSFSSSVPSTDAMLGSHTCICNNTAGLVSGMTGLWGMCLPWWPCQLVHLMTATVAQRLDMQDARPLHDAGTRISAKCRSGPASPRQRTCCTSMRKMPGWTLSMAACAEGGPCLTTKDERNTRKERTNLWVRDVCSLQEKQGHQRFSSARPEHQAVDFAWFVA